MAMTEWCVNCATSGLKLYTIPFGDKGEYRRLCDKCKELTMMTRYIGVKEVFARPMTRAQFDEYMSQEQVPHDPDVADPPGFLVEYVDGGGPNHPDHKGYVSWSPADVFEKAYRTMRSMTFGLAIEAMRRGHRVARMGWNGKGIFVYLECHAYVEDENAIASTDGHEFAPFIAMDTTGLVTDNPDAPKGVIPWLASQSDMLADDWVVLV